MREAFWGAAADWTFVTATADGCRARSTIWVSGDIRNSETGDTPTCWTSMRTVTSVVCPMVGTDALPAPSPFGPDDDATTYMWLTAACCSWHGTWVTDPSRHVAGTGR